MERREISRLIGASIVLQCVFGAHLYLSGSRAAFLAGSTHDGFLRGCVLAIWALLGVLLALTGGALLIIDKRIGLVVLSVTIIISPFVAVPTFVPLLGKVFPADLTIYTVFNFMVLCVAWACGRSEKRRGV